jgi:hypothetical protein
MSLLLLFGGRGILLTQGGRGPVIQAVSAVPQGKAQSVPSAGQSTAPVPKVSQ